MFDIPRITDEQLKLMIDVCFNPNMSVFSQCDPKPEDPLHEAVLATQAQKDTLHLCELGFLKDITGDHKERIEHLNAKTERVWKVYQITAMGRAMCQVETSKAIN
jgi:hypothetical protein